MQSFDLPPRKRREVRDFLTSLNFWTNIYLLARINFEKFLGYYSHVCSRENSKKGEICTGWFWTVYFWKYALHRSLFDKDFTL